MANVLSWMILLPIIGAVSQPFVPSRLSRSLAQGASLVSAILGVIAIISMQRSSTEIQLRDTVAWIGSYAISYDVGIDGLNALLVLLISIVFPLLICAEWGQKTGVRGMQGLLLILQASFLGAVCAQDLFLIFFFWSLSALPLYFLTAIWGGQNRESAGFRAMVSASAGNALFFCALVLIYFSTDPHSFSLKELGGGGLETKSFTLAGYELSTSAAAFTLMAMGLVLRLPIWPLHGWFRRVAEEAPPVVFVATCAVSVPIATYLFTRLGYTLFPGTINKTAHALMILGAVNLVFGCLCAASQRGLRRLLAYLCMSELGFLLIGIGSLTSPGVVGAVFQQFAMGIGLAGFGLFLGVMVDRMGHANFLDESGKAGFGGVVTQAPIMAVVTALILASLLGFPGLGGFVGHALLMIGSYSTLPITVLVAGGMLLILTYYLFAMYRHVFLGKGTSTTQSLVDLTYRERSYLFPIVIVLLVFGVFPKPLVETVRPTIVSLLEIVHR